MHQVQIFNQINQLRFTYFFAYAQDRSSATHAEYGKSYLEKKK